MLPQFQNFALMRVLAATTVIFSHSYLIAYGDEKSEPFVMLLGEGNILGIYGVFFFFIISGFLVTRSALSGSGVFAFTVKRALRIYPALFVCSFLSAAVLGSVFTSQPIAAFWSQLIPFQYTASTTLFPFSGWRVPTVAFPQFGPNTLHEGMNGSLWSISQELYCYGIVAILLLVGWLRVRVIATLSVGLALVFVATYSMDTSKWWSQVADFVFVVPFFIGGSLIFFVRERWGLDGKLALLISGFIMLSGFAGYFMPAFLLAAYPALWLATTDKVAMPTLEKAGDISYGLYLYGWPMLQVARVILGDYTTPATLFILAWPMSAALAYLSWHLLERHALAMAPVVARWPGKVATIFRRRPASEES